MRPLCPFPIGASKSITRIEYSPGADSKSNFLVGYTGVRLSKRVLPLTLFGSMPFTASTLNSAKNLSPSFGGRTCPETKSPVLKANFLICEGET